MNITRENLSELDLLIKVEIVESDYAEEVKKQLKSYKNKAMVPGFRKGMAPMGLIERMYKSAIVADTVQNLLSTSLYKYLDDEKLDIVGSPLINDEKTGKVDFESSKDYTFYFDAALMPKVELAWDKVDTKLYQIKVNPKDIDKRVDDIAKRFGKFESPETVSSVDDVVYGSVKELDKEGNVLEGGVNAYTSFGLSNFKNQDEIFPLFEGKKAEDKIVFNAAKAFSAADIETKFRIDAAAAKKFKSDVRFTLSGISHVTPHEVNDELFKKVFPNEEVKDVAAFRKLVSKDIEKQYNEQCEILYVNEVHKQLVDNFTAALPEAFLKRWILNREEGKEVTAESLEEQWAEKYVPSMRWEMVDAELNKLKKLEPTHREVLDYIKEILGENDNLQEGEDEKARDERLEQAAQSIAKERQNVQSIIDRLYSRNSFALYKEQLKPEAEKISIKDFGEKVK